MEISGEMLKMLDVAASEEFTDLLAAIGDFVAQATGNTAEFVAQWKLPCREPLFFKIKSGEKPVAIEFDNDEKSYFVKWIIGEESGYLYYNEDYRFNLTPLSVLAIETAIKINTESVIKKIEWGVETASRMQGITYHDYSNVFGSVSGVMQLLETDERGNKKLHNNLNEIYDILENFEELNKSTTRILRSEPITYQKELIDISCVANEILSKSKKVYAYSQIDLDFKVDENIKTSGDEQKIAQILNELLDNASDSFGNVEIGGKIIVRVFVEKLNCVISVTDTGFGMDYDLQRYLTTKYFTRKFKRPGLGLTRVRRFVEDWGGSLRFNSAPEKGTTVIARFPIVL